MSNFWGDFLKAVLKLSKESKLREFSVQFKFVYRNVVTKRNCVCMQLKVTNDCLKSGELDSIERKWKTMKAFIVFQFDQYNKSFSIPKLLINREGK